MKGVLFTFSLAILSVFVACSDEDEINLFYAGEWKVTSVHQNGKAEQLSDWSEFSLKLEPKENNTGLASSNGAPYVFIGACDQPESTELIWPKTFEWINTHSNEMSAVTLIRDDRVEIEISRLGENELQLDLAIREQNRDSLEICQAENPPVCCFIFCCSWSFVLSRMD